MKLALLALALALASASTCCDAQSGWSKYSNRFCPTKMRGYSSAAAAQRACLPDRNCQGIYDQSCDSRGTWYTCKSGTVQIRKSRSSQGSCMYQKRSHGKVVGSRKCTSEQGKCTLAAQCTCGPKKPRKHTAIGGETCYSCNDVAKQKKLQEPPKKCSGRSRCCGGIVPTPSCHLRGDCCRQLNKYRDEHMPKHGTGYIAVSPYKPTKVELIYRPKDCNGGFCLQYNGVKHKLLRFLPWNWPDMFKQNEMLFHKIFGHPAQGDFVYDIYEAVHPASFARQMTSVGLYSGFAGAKAGVDMAKKCTKQCRFGIVVRPVCYSKCMAANVGRRRLQNIRRTITLNPRFTESDQRNNYHGNGHRRLQDALDEKA